MSKPNYNEPPAASAPATVFVCKPELDRLKRVEKLVRELASRVEDAGSLFRAYFNTPEAFKSEAVAFKAYALETEARELLAELENECRAGLEWLGLRELTQYAALSERTLRARIHSPVDPLPAVRMGGKILVNRRAFDAWLQAHTLEPANSPRRLERNCL